MEVNHLIVFHWFDSSEINVVLLDDAGIQRVEVHNKDEFVPEPPLGHKNETSFIFIAFAFRGFLASLFIVFLRFGLTCLFSVGLVGAEILQTMEFVKENVLVPLGTSTIQRLVP